MRKIRFGVFVGAVTIAALSACGGKSSARAGGATGGAAGASVGATGGAAGASVGATGGAASVGGGSSDAGISLACTGEGATRLIGGVRHRCTNGIWTPITECTMGGDVNACCGGHAAMRSADVAADPCLVPFPNVTNDGSSACVRTTQNCGFCGLVDAPEPRTAELDSTGTCVATSECQHSTDCVVAVNNLACCSCPAPFPKTMLAAEPCLSAAKALPVADCADCSAVDCAPCPPITDVKPRCIPNGSGIRSCVYADVVGADCHAQDAAGVYPDPQAGTCLPAMWTWNGTACVQFQGCLCTGADCGALFASPYDCLNQYHFCGAVCVPGMDQTCNDELIMSSIAGRCETDGTCTCSQGRTYVQSSGRCR